MSKRTADVVERFLKIFYRKLVEHKVTSISTECLKPTMKKNPDASLVKKQMYDTMDQLQREDQIRLP